MKDIVRDTVSPEVTAQLEDNTDLARALNVFLEETLGFAVGEAGGPFRAPISIGG